MFGNFLSVLGQISRDPGHQFNFYTDEKTSDFTMHVGDTVDLTAQVLPLTIQGVKVEWTSGNTDYLTVTSTGDLSCTVECIGNISGGVKLTATCLGVEKTLTVYCVE